ncbi:hypothetical protein SAMN04487820_103200 [Actinopolyspora mzabensis]|uniref:Uncharacterized protein n=1 Tax=Actinopolyspora mzabensis TaxID=995066 RepID=A0A1G8Y3K9_ACTMZ|nr:hypothetical protein [Actinopolyspora mzabensis]SDJ96705.1 hypothetical protein SAMN04487820_103200 [Actinopolyspora mzabensis]
MNGQRPTRRIHRDLIGGVVLALLTASCWWVWMAWDNGYHTDPATGATSGPYQAWQVIGCVVCLIGLGVLATARMPWWLVLAIMPLSFTAAWSWTAAGTDGTGLWAVGAVLILAGMLAGTGLVTGLTTVVRSSRTRIG